MLIALLLWRFFFFRIHSRQRDIVYANRQGHRGFFLLHGKEFSRVDPWDGSPCELEAHTIDDDLIKQGGSFMGPIELTLITAVGGEKER